MENALGAPNPSTQGHGDQSQGSRAVQPHPSVKHLIKKPLQKLAVEDELSTPAKCQHTTRDSSPSNPSTPIFGFPPRSHSEVAPLYRDINLEEKHRHVQTCMLCRWLAVASDDRERIFKYSTILDRSIDCTLCLELVRRVQGSVDTLQELTTEMDVGINIYRNRIGCNDIHVYLPTGCRPSFFGLTTRRQAGVYLWSHTCSPVEITGRFCTYSCISSDPQNLCGFPSRVEWSEC